MKTCRSCREKFEPKRPLQVACSPECARKIVETAKAKRAAREAREERKADMVRRHKLKTKKELTEDVQDVVNRYVRLRDKGLPCISCGMEYGCQWHAGHYRETFRFPELRFHLDNINKQCSQCNRQLHGNLVEYRKGLVKRIGLERVEALENWPRPRAKWSHDDLWEIRETFLRKIKELEAMT